MRMNLNRAQSGRFKNKQSSCLAPGLLTARLARPGLSTEMHTHNLRRKPNHCCNLDADFWSVLFLTLRRVQRETF